MSSAGSFPLSLVAFTGRFQPFHRDHLEMVGHALRLASKVVIGITNPDASKREPHPSSKHRHLAESNPLTCAQRKQLVVAALQAEGMEPSRFDIVPFPLDEVQRWPELIPLGTPQLVRVFSDWEREKVRRFAAAGYPPIVIEGNPATRLEATAVRRAMAASGRVPDDVPPGARELLSGWLDPVTGVLRGG